MSDGKGGTSDLTVTISVAETSGSLGFSITFNTAPSVDGMSIDNAQPKSGDTVAVAVQASDADNDPLTYQWSSTCSGTFSSTSTAATSFTLTAGAGACQFDVKVDDGRGGTNSGTLQISPGSGSVSYQNGGSATPTVLSNGYSQVGDLATDGTSVFAVVTPASGTLVPPTQLTTQPLPPFEVDIVQVNGQTGTSTTVFSNFVATPGFPSNSLAGVSGVFLAAAGGGEAYFTIPSAPGAGAGAYWVMAPFEVVPALAPLPAPPIQTRPATASPGAAAGELFVWDTLYGSVWSGGPGGAPAPPSFPNPLPSANQCGAAAAAAAGSFYCVINGDILAQFAGSTNLTSAQPFTTIATGISGVGTVNAIAVGGSSIVLATSGGIYVSSTTPGSKATSLVAGTNATALAADGLYAYYIDPAAAGGPSIDRIPLAGGAPQQLATGQNGAGAIAITSNTVFWSMASSVMKLALP